MGREFTVTVPRSYTFEEGFGVAVIPIWEMEDDDTEPSRIATLDVEVVPIREGLVCLVGEVPCVPSPSSDKMFYPVENFQRLGVPGETAYDDTHDLRDRFYDTEDEANTHAEFTMQRFEHPNPWESFVQL